MSQTNDALLSFSLGPVQEFIAAARTTRDLWIGSYLLSWLTAAGIAAVKDQGGTLLFPEVDANPMYLAFKGKHANSNQVTLACLPNTFLASVPADKAKAIAQECKAAVQSEWGLICDKVHDALNKDWEALREDWPDGWDCRWSQQIESFWGVRVTFVLTNELDEAMLTRLLLLSDDTLKKEHGLFKARLEYLARLAASQKAIRHYPPHEVWGNGDNERDTRPKCSLLGTYAQMGPIAQNGEGQMKTSTAFWEAVIALEKERRSYRLTKRDRFCAISLVKRLAWGAYFQERLGGDIDRRYPDIDTICAAEWLAEAKAKIGLDIETTRTTQNTVDWSGHWLRWKSPLEGDEEGEICPEHNPPEYDRQGNALKTWELIQRAKSKEYCGPPPIYYAVLMLDGDQMGEKLRHADEQGPQGRQNISQNLADYAMKSVPAIVNKHCGTLVYAGGDDVLTFLPAARALNCAAALHGAFPTFNFAEETFPKCSAGIVIAHYKEPLRIVLQTARETEKAAKDAGRDCLALSIRKRSGEHTTTICPWDCVPKVLQLFEAFQERGSGEEPASDRWAYQLARDLPTLEGLDEEAVRALIRRQIHRAEKGTRRRLGHGDENQAASTIVAFFDAYRAALVNGRRPFQHAQALKQFIVLCQSASFLARGGKE